MSDLSSRVTENRRLASGRSKPLMPRLERQTKKRNLVREFAHLSSGSRTDNAVQRRLRSLNSQSQASELSKLYSAQQGLSFFLGVGAGTSFVVRGVPAKSHRPGSARSATGPLWTAVPGTNSRTITAIGGAHSPLSRFTRGANTDRRDVPRTGG